MRKIVIISSSLILTIGALALFLLNMDKKPEVVEAHPISAFQCRGKIISENLFFQSKFTIIDLNFTEEEILEIIKYQLMFGFSNFQYSFLETPLQNISLRNISNIKINNKNRTSYGREIEGKVLLPDFLNIKNRKWPEKILSSTQALEVEYEVSLDVDYCVKSSLVSLEDLPLYFPVDPIYAYYFLDKTHWGHITKPSEEESITLNRCQNYHHFFETDEEFSKHYWSQWNPKKRGKEAHTDHYDCKDWLVEGKDFFSIKPLRTKVDSLFYYGEEKVESEQSRVVLKFITNLKNEDKKSLYEVATTEILTGKDYLHTLPHVSLEDKKLFKWIGELSSYLTKISKIELVKNDKSLKFKFHALLNEKEKYFELLIGNSFTEQKNCEIGITSSFDFIKAPLSFASNCEEEFFYIPLSSLSLGLQENKNLSNRAYFLVGWPSLLDGSSGAYILDFISKRETTKDLELSKYLEVQNREDAFTTLPSFSVNLSEM